MDLFLKLWPGISAQIAHIGQGIVVAYLFFPVLERFISARPFEINGFLISAKLSFIHIVLSPIAAAIPVYWVNQFVYHQTFPIKINMLLHAYMFPNWAWLIAFIPLPFFIYDFFYYWFHRLQHSSFLWEQHKLHHADKYLSVATAMRHHWLEGFLRAFLLTLPMGLVFKITPFQSYILSFILLQWGFFIHANVRVTFGPLTGWLAGPQYHRIHHSIEPQHRDKNFAAFFPVWDILFRTYYKPAKNEYPETGVVGAESNASIKDILFGPFIAWLRLDNSIHSDRSRRDIPA